MINTLALNLIADVMDWDNEVATEEYAWLRLISAMKYDGYSDFRAGVRFLESLVSWLRHFEPADRAPAYAFVKSRLIYISTLEMQRLIETFLPETVTPYLRRSVASELGIQPYEVWQSVEAARAFKRKLRRCLFVGLSDGSRIDVLRRANAGKMSQEQVLPMMNIDDDKWRDLAKDLKKDLGDEDARFDDVYLIDDFTASGTTFIRFPKGEPKGKLAKFEKIVKEATTRVQDFPLAAGYTLHIHHYLSTAQAHDALVQRLTDADAMLLNRSYGDWHITEGMPLPDAVRLGVVDKSTRIVTPTDNHDVEVLDLCDRYYDHELFARLEKHCREAGQSDMKYGYADCVLPVVLDHNTPNNSVPILWAETGGSKGAKMQPLFYRRDRHG